MEPELYAGGSSATSSEYMVEQINSSDSSVSHVAGTPLDVGELEDKDSASARTSGPVADTALHQANSAEAQVALVGTTDVPFSIRLTILLGTILLLLFLKQHTRLGRKWLPF